MPDGTGADPEKMPEHCVLRPVVRQSPVVREAVGERFAGMRIPAERNSGGHEREIGLCAEGYSGPVWQCVRNEHIESCIGIFGNMSPRWSAPASW